MTPDRARYHLRYQVHPAGDIAARAQALVKVCLDLEIDEVVLLLAAEELFSGHLAGADEDRWFTATGIAAQTLRAAGLAVSLNPWVTSGHADRGRGDRLGFAPMVSPSGQPAAGQASFACPRWREWITGHYGRFAELGFRVLWLEDDFRYHNHSPLDWGGGFEPLMLERLERLVGEPVTRERLVEAMTAPGEPHPWRALMHQVWRTAQLEVARMVSTEVARRSGGRSRLGLMSSRPDAASAEGRDWDALFDALRAGDLAAVHRPHFAEYTDAPASVLGGQLWLLEAQRGLRPPGVDSEAEIENWPYTSWTKSDTQTWSEMTAAQFAGSDALLINVWPNHDPVAIERYPAVGEMLRRSRPALDWIAARYPSSFTSAGIGLPVRPAAATFVHLDAGDPRDLTVGPEQAAEFLLSNGVPVAARPPGTSTELGAVFGRLAWALHDAEIRELLSGGLLLDGVAASILQRRGFGQLTGVAVHEVVARDRRPPDPRPYAIERVLTDDQGLAGVPLSLNLQPAVARMTALNGAEVWTGVEAPDGSRWGDGRTLFRNELGGRVAVLAAGAPAALPGSDDARRLLHHIVRALEAGRSALPLVSGAPRLFPHLAYADGVARLAIANGSADPAVPAIDLPGVHREEVTVTRLAPLREPRPGAIAVTEHGRPGSGTELGHRGWLVLEWVPQSDPTKGAQELKCQAAAED